MRNQSSTGHEHPSILSQLCMDSDDWHCIHIHNSAEHYMRPLHSTVEEADLRIPVHVLESRLSPGRLQNMRCYLHLYRCDRCPTVSRARLSPRGTGRTMGTWYGQGEVPPPVLCPFILYMHGCVLIIYAESFQHYIPSPAVISPAILVSRKRLSRLKNDPLAQIWHND